MQRFSTGTSWFLGDGPRQLVLARTFDAVPDSAAARVRLQELTSLRAHSRDSVEEIRALLEGLPEERIPDEIVAWPERSEAVRTFGWVTRPHEGVVAGFATHQDAAELMFRLRNHVGGLDDQGR
jgi:hypothetical protein